MGPSQQPANASARFELHLESLQGGPGAVDLIARHCALGRGRIKSVMSKGAVWLENDRGTQRIRRVTRALKPGDRIHVYYDPDIINLDPPAAGLIADEGEYSVWTKPAGMYSQGSKWGDHCSIYRYAETRLEPTRQAWLVHRLDRAASGLILLAHRRKTATLLSGLFQRREVDKRYRARVEGQFEAALPFAIDLPLDGKPSVSVIESARFQAADNTTQIEIRILTGRKHQIRRHLRAQGHPLVGDRLYGARDQASDLQLTSCELGFVCPISGERRDYRLPPVPIDGGD